MSLFRPVKSGNGGIGGAGKKNRPKNLKRSSLLKVSKKQRKRLRELRRKKSIVLNAMHERWGGTFCMAAGSREIECWGPLDWDHVRPAGRQGVDKDDFENAQLICRAHHVYKTTTPGLYDLDYRSSEMKQFMEELNVLSDL